MSTNWGSYAACVVRPMSENGDGKPLIQPAHLLDAGIVAGIVFLSVLGGDVLLAVFDGGSVFLTVGDIRARLLTAAIAFGTTFLAQWARYRGIKAVSHIPGVRADVPHTDDDK